MQNFDKEEYLISLFKNKHIGDDGAIIDDMVYSMDAFNEGVHFQREWMSMSQIGTKAMIVNISDAVAMNAKPLYALVSISLPQDITHTNILELISALNNTATDYGCEIIGGDTTSGKNLNISITIISRATNPLKRDTLQPNDLLAYTGRLGESKADLKRLLSGDSISPNSRFYQPALRSEFISEAREKISAGMDISDGLFCDTNKLLDINKYGIEILKNISDEIGSSGEEYEMLISFSIKNKIAIEEIAKQMNLSLTIFAKVTDKNKFRYPCKSHHF